MKDLTGLGNRFKPRMSTAQVPVALGASGTLANDGNNNVTLTFTAAHGLTLRPAAGVMGNFFCTFTGATAETGGTLNGNIFRIMKIPSATTIVIYSTETAATVTGASLIPVFFVPFTQMPSNYGGTMGPSDATGVVAPPALRGNPTLLQLGANCTWKVNYDSPSTAVILDPVTTPSTGTPTTAPNWMVGIQGISSGAGVAADATVDVGAAFSQATLNNDFATVANALGRGIGFGGYQECLWASGTAGTSYAMVYND